MARESTPAAVTSRQILEEGVRIITIILFWGLLAVLARYGIGNIGFSRPGSLFFELVWHLAMLFTAAGFASILLFVGGGVRRSSNSTGEPVTASY